ncbi:MAG: hypothetical protein GY856_34440, partial [bacterium]|nr:hypothetical protein [bacterium]
MPDGADGTWYAHVCAGDEAGNWTAAATAGPYVISTAAATVTLVTTVADTGDGQLSANEWTTIPITQLYVDFSRPMNDPAGDGSSDDVTNPASYRLIADGGDRVVDTTGCAGVVDPADEEIAIERVDYASTPRRSTLWIHGGVPLPAASYRLGGVGLVDVESPSVDPVLDLEIRDPAVVPDVAGDQGRAMNERDRRDQQVGVGKPLALALELGLQTPELLARRRVQAMDLQRLQQL